MSATSTPKQAFPSTPTARTRRRLTLPAAAAAVAVAVAMATAAPAGAFTSTYVSGAHRNLVFSGENNYCSRGTVMTLRPTVTGTASYPRSGQTIYMLPTVEWSSDGSHWYLYKTNEHWESLNVHGAGAAGSPRRT